jgi:hypothetical protein
MPVVIGNANLVVVVFDPLLFTSLATPVDASFHQLYADTPRAATGGLSLSNIPIFSSNVMRAIAS